MRVRLDIGPSGRWIFRAEPEVLASSAPESSEEAGGSGRERVTRWGEQIWNRVVREYHLLAEEIERRASGGRSLLRPFMRVALRLMRALEARSDPSESLFKQMRTAAQVELLYPAHLPEPLVRRRFVRWARRRSRAHARGMVVMLLLLPVTAAMALLPGPNVFFAWNAYRLLSHYLARDGARRLVSGRCPLVLVPHVDVAPDAVGGRVRP